MTTALAAGESSRTGSGRTTRPGPGAGRPNVRRGLEIGAFIGPALVVYVLFVLLPIGLAAYYSLFKWNGIEPLTNFIGLENYQRALADPVFRGAIGHNVFIVIGSILVQLPLALGLALLLNRKIRGRGVLRTLLFVPYVLSEVVTGVIWAQLLMPYGLVDGLFLDAGVAEPPLWLADQNIVMWTMLAVISWKYVGFAIILLLAALQGIPAELEEAAAIDGASWWQIQRAITIPLLGPTIRIWIFLSMIGSLQLFDLIWIMTGGGPAGATATMGTYLIDQGFTRGQFGYGSAVAVILFGISFVAAIFYQRFVLRRDIAGAVTTTKGRAA